MHSSTGLSPTGTVTLAFAFATSPFIATTFAGPAAAQAFLRGSGWRWAFGTFSILTPVVAAPVVGVLWVNTRKARQFGMLVGEEEGRTKKQSLWHYVIEFDGKPGKHWTLDGVLS